MLRFTNYYAECDYAECLYAEFRHAECRGSKGKWQVSTPPSNVILSFATLSQVKHAVVLKILLSCIGGRLYLPVPFNKVFLA